MQGMKTNERGGFLSSLFVIPIGLALMVAIFFAGYFIGKSQGEGQARGEKPPTLPDVVADYLPKKEDLTFYHTLTEKGERSLSIDLAPKPQEPGKAPAAPGPQKNEGGGSSVDRPPHKAARAPEAGLASRAPQAAASRQEPQKPKASAPKPVGIKYSIQIASYPDKDMADEEVKGMKKRGYAAFWVATQIPDKGMWYRVRVGSFTNKAQADKLAQELKNKEGLNPFVTAE